MAWLRGKSCLVTAAWAERRCFPATRGVAPWQQGPLATGPSGNRMRAILNGVRTAATATTVTAVPGEVWPAPASCEPPSGKNAGTWRVLWPLLPPAIAREPPRPPGVEARWGRGRQRSPRRPLWRHRIGCRVSGPCLARSTEAHRRRVAFQRADPHGPCVLRRHIRPARLDTFRVTARRSPAVCQSPVLRHAAKPWPAKLRRADWREVQPCSPDR